MAPPTIPLANPKYLSTDLTEILGTPITVSTEEDLLAVLDTNDNKVVGDSEDAFVKAGKSRDVEQLLKEKAPSFYNTFWFLKRELSYVTMNREPSNELCQGMSFAKTDSTHAQYPHYNTNHDLITDPINAGCITLESHPNAPGNMMRFDHGDYRIQGAFSINDKQELVPDPNGDIVISVSLGANNSDADFSQHVGMFMIQDVNSGNQIKVNKKGVNLEGVSVGLNSHLDFKSSVFENPSTNYFQAPDLSLTTVNKADHSRTIHIVYEGEQNLDITLALTDMHMWGDGFRDKDSNRLRAYRCLGLGTLDVAQSKVIINGQEQSLQNVQKTETYYDLAKRIPAGLPTWDWLHWDGKVTVDGHEENISVVVEGIRSLRSGSTAPQWGQIVILANNQLTRTQALIQFAYDPNNMTAPWKVTAQDEKGKTILEFNTPKVDFVDDKSNKVPGVVNHSFFSGWGQGNIQLNMPNLTATGTGLAYLESSVFIERLTDGTLDAEKEAYEAELKKH